MMMGLIINHTIVVSSWDKAATATAAGIARYIFGRINKQALVSNVIPHAVNGGGAFFISPDGSKEGWSDSTDADEARREFVEYLKGEAGLDWAEIRLGGDESTYQVLAHAGDEA